MGSNIPAFIGWAGAVLVVVHTAIQLYFLVRAFFERPPTLPLPEPLPTVSVLVPVRNEAATIERCLRCLAQLDYPADRLEIIIGDDHSTDDTATRVAAFIRGRPSFRLIKVGPPVGQARAKANALVYLTRAARGNIYLITDADGCVPPTWIRAMLRPFSDPRVGIVSGVTLLEARRCPGFWQSLEWLYFLSLLRFLPARDVTAIGNNMAVRKTAYEATGGYERIPFSVTEDLALYQEVLRRGWKHRYVFRPEALIYSLPVPFAVLIKQRFRWLQGVKRLPLRVRALFAVKALFPLGIAGWAIVAPPVAGAFWLLNYGMQLWYLHRMARRLRVRFPLSCRLSFEFYQYFLNGVMGLLFFRPARVEWKGRRF